MPHLGIFHGFVNIQGFSIRGFSMYTKVRSHSYSEDLVNDSANTDDKVTDVHYSIIWLQTIIKHG